MSKVTEQVQIRIPINDMTTLKDKAWESRMSMAEYLRRLIHACAEQNVDLYEPHEEKVRTTAQLSPEDKAWLKSKSSELNLSVDEIVRTIIKKAVQGNIHHA